MKLSNSETPVIRLRGSSKQLNQPDSINTSINNVTLFMTLNETIKHMIVEDMKNLPGDDNRNIILSLHGSTYNINTEDPITKTPYGISENIEEWCLLFNDTKVVSGNNTKFYTMIHVDSLLNFYLNRNNTNQVYNPMTNRLINIETDVILLNSEHINYDTNTSKDNSMQISNTQHPFMNEIIKIRDARKLRELNFAKKYEYEVLANIVIKVSMACGIAFLILDSIPESEISEDISAFHNILQNIKMHSSFVLFFSIVKLGLGIILKCLARIPD